MRIWTLLCLLVLMGCDTQNTLDCLQTNGDRIQEIFDVSNFDKIRVRERIQLVIIQGDSQSVIIETGSNLLDDVSAIVENGELILRDANACNLVRAYQPSIAYVTTPQLTAINNQSGLTVTNQGILEFGSLLLKSEDFTENDRINTDGDFRLNLKVESLRILSNNLSNFFLTGTANSADFQIFSGDSRIEAQDLIVQDLQLFHRGTNQMFVYPVDRIRGEIRSGGDVISLNRPPEVDVVEFYTGRLIFQD